MAEHAAFTENLLPDGGRELHLSGNWAISCIDRIDDDLRLLAGEVTQINLSAVAHMDTVGAWLVYRTARDHGATIAGGNDHMMQLINRVGKVDRRDFSEPAEPSAFFKFLAEIGEAVQIALATMFDFLAFMGQTIKAGIFLLFNPRQFRFHAVVQHFDMVGVRALGIIGLMSFLIGIVIAQQGAVQLRQFGAEVFTINLIGRLTFRELGILMTAIMIAGRSGSAFAAQIGTMKITEEIDAMRTIGVSPSEALVVPRMLATVIMLPLLGIYASLVAVIGGGITCWIDLDIPPATYVQRLREVIPMTDYYIGLIKAPVFGAIIAMAGCFQGMQVSGNSEQVGLKTTAAVVQAIFLVIVLDAFFAVFFSSIGWN